MGAISSPTAPSHSAESHGSRRFACRSGSDRGRPGPRRDRLTLLLLASVIVSFRAASSAPTPLYALYAARWGFSPLATTVVFGVYALAVLAGLLTFGKLSDHVGRRPVLLAALFLQAVAMVQFATAGGLGTLLGARIVQGVATGSVLGAAGAALLDLDRRRDTLANSSAPGAGTALGALVSALAVQYLPAPTRFIYLVNRNSPGTWP
jgi:MFS family permease